MSPILKKYLDPPLDLDPPPPTLLLASAESILDANNNASKARLARHNIEVETILLR